MSIGGTADYEMKPPWVRNREGKSRQNTTLGDRVRNPGDSLVTSREVTHLSTGPEFGKWLVRAI